MTQLRHIGAWLALMLTAAACAPSATPGTASGPQAAAPQSAAPIQRTLVMLARGEPPSISGKSLQAFSGSLNGPIRMFNGTLDYVDENEGIHPYQAEELPRLNTDSWQVFPDGTMQTTYRLRPSLTWHDGAPLTSDDFVFAWQVYGGPNLGLAHDTMAEAFMRVYPQVTGTLR